VREVVISGVGLHKLGRFDGKSYVDMACETIRTALKDANVSWKEIQSAYCSRMYLPPTTGVRVCAAMGLTAIPVWDIESACASGGSALRSGFMAVAGGFYDTVLVFGVEKMPRGFMSPENIYDLWQCYIGLSVNPMYFALEARTHMDKYGSTPKHFAKVSVKNHKHGALNPYAMYQKECTLDEVMNSRMVCDPLHLLELCAPNEGSAALVLTTRNLAVKRNTKPITVCTSVVKTPLYPPPLFPPAYQTSAKIQSQPLTTLAARQAYEESGIGPKDLDLVELQDVAAPSEIFYSEELELCPPGEGCRILDEGVTEIGGRLPINASGGLLSNGEPIGASGLRQVVELAWQLRGEAGRRQVEGAKVGLSHVVGAGPNCGVVILKK
jgi:acetyl-CoA C-acetyltransferase